MNKEILRIALPSIAQNVTVPLLGFADTAISGHLGGAEYIGAVAVGGMVFNMLYWLCAFLRMSTGGLTAQAFGRAAGGELAPLLLRALRIGLFISLAILVLQVPLGRVALRFFDASPDVEQLAGVYYSILVWGAPAVLMSYGLAGWFLGSQDARTPMVVAVVQNVLNILLSLFFVIVLGWRVEGVAAGTLIAQWAGLLMYLFAVPHYAREYLLRSLKLVTRHSSLVTRQCSLVPSHGRVELMLFLRTLCMVSVQIFFTRLGAAQGAVVLAANAVLLQFYMLFSYFMDGFAYAGEAVGGKYFGAQDRGSFVRLIKHLFLWGAGLTLLFTLLYYFSGAGLLRLLTDEVGVVATAVEYLPYASLIPLCGVAAFLFDGLCVGTTSTRLLLASVVFGMIAFFAVVFLPASLTNDVLWLAMLAFLVVRGIVQAVFVRTLLPCPVCR